MECIKKFKLTTVENGRLICPLHTCATCAADENKTQKACKGKMLFIVFQLNQNLKVNPLK